MQSNVKCDDRQFRALSEIHRFHVQSVLLPLYGSLQTTVLFTTNTCRLNEESNIQLKRKMQRFKLSRSQCFSSHKSRPSRTTWENQPPPSPSLSSLIRVDDECQELCLPWKWELKRRANKSSIGSSNLLPYGNILLKRPSKVYINQSRGCCQQTSSLCLTCRKKDSESEFISTNKQVQWQHNAPLTTTTMESQQPIENYIKSMNKINWKDIRTKKSGVVGWVFWIEGII